MLTLIPHEALKLRLYYSGKSSEHAPQAADVSVLMLHCSSAAPHKAVTWRLPDWRQHSHTRSSSYRAPTSIATSPRPQPERQLSIVQPSVGLRRSRLWTWPPCLECWLSPRSLASIVLEHKCKLSSQCFWLWFLTDDCTAWHGPAWRVHVWKPFLPCCL